LGGQPIKDFKHGKAVRSVCWTADGMHLISGGDDSKIYLWDFISGSRVCLIDGRTDQFWSVVASPDCSVFASISREKSLQLWTAGSSKINPSDMPLCIAFSPDGARVAWGGLGGLFSIQDAPKPIKVCSTAADHDTLT